jgi:peptide/nickel transport system ATP-binding protein
MMGLTAEAPAPDVLPGSAASAPLLCVRDLHVHFVTSRGVVRAVEGLSYDVSPGEVVALVGESGCGKSVSALSIMRLLAKPAGRVAHGEILFEGRDLLGLSEAEMRELRGEEISMIFQEPMTSLNPVFTIGDQITETLFMHREISRQAARARAVDLLQMVGLTDPSAASTSTRTSSPAACASA